MPPPRPFPFPALSIGTDIAATARIHELVANRHAFVRFVGKVLTAREQHYFYRRFGERLSRADSDNGRHWKSGNEKFLRDVGKFLCGR